MTNDEVQEIIDRAEDEYDKLKDRVHEQYDEIERLNTNLKVANEDLTRIAQLLNLEEGCTIYDIEDKIERLNNIIEKIDEFISYKIIIETNAKGYQITLKDLTDIKKKLLELKGVDKE